MKFLLDLFSNPDGSGSTKRTAGWIVLAATLTMVFAFSTHPSYEFTVGALLTFAGGLFGMSSYDYSTYMKKGTEAQQPIPQPNVQPIVNPNELQQPPVM
jgi:hypothetical protein